MTLWKPMASVVVTPLSPDRRAVAPATSARSWRIASQSAGPSLAAAPRVGLSAAAPPGRELHAAGQRSTVLRLVNTILSASRRAPRRPPTINTKHDVLVSTDIIVTFVGKQNVFLFDAWTWLPNHRGLIYSCEAYFRIPLRLEGILKKLDLKGNCGVE